MTIYIRPFVPLDADSLLSFKLRNKSFMKESSLLVADSHYTYEEQIKEIGINIVKAQKDQEYHFGIFRTQTNELIGKISLTNIIRGTFQSANISYSIDHFHTGKGYMTSSLTKIIDYSFNHLGLHRIQAAVPPNNEASIRVLEKNNFTLIGLSKNYLKLNNDWKDHYLYAITNN